MRNKLRFLTALCAILLLTGCTDASVKIKDSKDVLFTVGNTKITKGKAFDSMMVTNSSSTAYNAARKAIADIEIEVTDEMKEDAESTLESYKSMFGDQFEDVLSSSNMKDEEEYLNDYILANNKIGKLTDKYVEEKFDEMCEKYKPVKVVVLNFPTQEDSDKALAMINDGEELSVAASENNSTSTGTSEVILNNSTNYEENVIKKINKLTKVNEWQQIAGSDGASYFLVKLESSTPADFKDDAVTAIKNTGELENDVDKFFFDKYKFKIYDIRLLNSMKKDHTDLVNQ